MLESLIIDATSWHETAEDISALSRLQEALWQECKLRLIYQRGDITVERLIDPLGLVAKGSTWYLIAAMDGEVRTYRVSRIKDIVLVEQPCVRPEGFDLATYWRQSSIRFIAAIPDYPVTVGIAPEVLVHIQRAGRYARIERMEDPDERGNIKIYLHFETQDAACGYLLSFGTQVEILEPLELRAKVVCLAESVAAFYGQVGV